MMEITSDVAGFTKVHKSKQKRTANKEQGGLYEQSQRDDKGQMDHEHVPGMGNLAE